LITSNDSRIRLYDLRDLSLVCKYRGFSNSTVHIKASLSHDDRWIVCGSKNKCTYLWKTNYPYSMLSTGRRDRNNCWERMQVHNAVVTCAQFAPKPLLVLNEIAGGDTSTADTSNSGGGGGKHKEKRAASQGVYVVASAAGCDGLIKLCINKVLA
jgi:WD40 repeat protein